MKTANRASRKAGKNSPSAQSATAPKIEPGEPLTAGLTLRFLSGKNKTEIERITLPSEIASALEQHEREVGEGIGQFVERAIREKLSALERHAERERGFNIVEFEWGINRISALLELLQCKLISDNAERLNPGPNYSAMASRLVCGYQEMIADAQLSLDDTFNSVCSLAQAKGGAR